MAQNTAEDTNPSVDKTESSEVTTCATNKTVPCDEKEKIELIDADTAELTPVKKRKIAENADSRDSKEQSNIREDDCNGDPEEEPTLAKEASSVKINRVKTKETKEDDPAESRSAEPKSSGAEDDALIREEEKRLTEILKVVHADLDIKYFQKSAGQAVTAKNDDDVREKEQQAVKAAGAPEKHTTESAEESIIDTATVENSVDEKKDSRESSEKAAERSEVGIVGPPTAVSELINEEELGGDSALSVDPKDHIAEWVENSVKADAMSDPVNVEEEDNAAEEHNRQRKRKNVMDVKLQKVNDALHSRKSQRIVSNIIKKSIKCLNRMHSLMGEYGKNVKDAGKNSRKSRKASPNNIPQSQQNGAALPGEASTSSVVDKQPHCSRKKSSKSPTETSRRKTKSNSNAVTNRKRKAASEEEEFIGELPVFKKCCSADREKQIENLVGQKEGTSEEFVKRAEDLRMQIEALDHLAHDKEKEWNNILSMRKLKEEAYLRLKRLAQVANFMESGNDLEPESVPLTDLWVEPVASSSGEASTLKEKSIIKENLSEIVSQDSADTKKHNIGKVIQQETAFPKNNQEDDRRQSEPSNTVTRKLTEGRQGTKVAAQSVIDDFRSKNPEIVPRRGRRMRNSVNVGLTAGGAMVETGHNVDSRPSSTDSYRSNPNATDLDSMSFKDVLIKFARLSQKVEPSTTPQNYPDVTLHPVPPSTTSQNTAPQQTASLLHGILTKAQTPKPATFSPTLAKLLTAPERERSSPTATASVAAAPTTSSATIVTATTAAPIPQQGTSATQHLLQAYHGSNLGTIDEILSSSKARSEITITPVVNPPAPQSHSNNVIHVEDVEEESAVIDDREGRYSAVVRDSREERDNPRCQGCQERAAQFVCAGCGNQWYCSRDCQVAAWDEHSEVCSG